MLNVINIQEVRRIFDVKQFLEAKVVSRSFKESSDGIAILVGDFTFRGITKSLTIDASPVSHGHEPWFGYRRSFVGKRQFNLADYSININILTEESNVIYLVLSVECIRG